MRRVKLNDGRIGWFHKWTIDQPSEGGIIGAVIELDGKCGWLDVDDFKFIDKPVRSLVGRRVKWSYDFSGSGKEMTGVITDLSNDGRRLAIVKDGTDREIHTINQCSVTLIDDNDPKDEPSD